MTLLQREKIVTFFVEKQGDTILSRKSKLPSPVSYEAHQHHANSVRMH